MHRVVRKRNFGVQASGTAWSLKEKSTECSRSSYNGIEKSGHLTYDEPRDKYMRKSC